MIHRKSTPVPRVPEPLVALQARYPRALEHVYDQVAIRDCGSIRPGEVAANVFDFEDGLRMIVSCERTPDGAIQLHFSASITRDCQIAEELLALRRKMGAEAIFVRFAQSIPARFCELSGDKRIPELVDVSADLIPHFRIVEEVTP